MMKLVHFIYCSVSKQKFSVVLLCMTKADTPFGEYLRHISWKDIARTCEVQSQETSEANFLLVFVKILLLFYCMSCFPSFPVLTTWVSL